MMKNEQIREHFNEGWNSVAIIDCDAILHNLKMLKSQVPTNTMQMAVVKADAYGHGAVEVSRRIESSVDYLGVANPLEGKELRENGITKPILVFGSPHAGNAHLYKNFDLIATISALDQFEVLPPGTNYHIKFDTGMGRVGIMPQDVEKTSTLIAKYSSLNYEGLMTHFANSEDVGSPIFEQQRENFNKIVAALGKDVIVHASNSGATLHQTDVHFDLIRGGTAVYGFDPSGVYNPALKPAMRWVSRLAQVRPMKKGAGVSYSHSWHLPENGNIGVIPVGYADGITRKLSNRIHLNINGKDYPQVGNITMDQIMVFLQDDAPLVDSIVEILGGNAKQSAYLWADLIGTITYEITCLVGNRVKRVYS
jgi:alanine racemase